MSGGGSGGPPISTGDSKSCDIVVRVPLNSVKADVLKKLKVGEVLSVEVENNRLLAKLGDEVAGALTPRAMTTLIKCILDQEYSYSATVIQIRGALCEVEVRPS